MLLQRWTDKLAIGLSMACAAHCVLTPAALVLLPALAATPLGSEQFHIWMLVVVLPTSLFAIGMGCRRHRDAFVLTLAIIGISLLVLAVLVGEALNGAWGDRVLTLIGSGFVVVAHVQNYRRCWRAGCAHGHDPVREVAP
jgi:carbon starvation protein CstA